jgi:hypothetical protein
MLSKEYSNTARALLRIARTMSNENIVDRLKVLAEDYERRAKMASHSESTKPLAAVVADGEPQGSTIK